MKSFIAIGLFVSSAVSLASIVPTDRYILDEVVPEVEEVETPESAYATLACEDNHTVADADSSSDSDGSEEIGADTIVNLGEKVWNVIADNKPAVHASSAYANALPSSVRGATDLENFSEPQFKSFRMHGKNGFGLTVYDVTYTLVHRYGGTLGGKGQFLENVTVLPHKISALWGYKVSMTVNDVSAVNVGSKVSPVASVLLDMHFRVATLAKSTEYRNVFEFRGDSPTVHSI